MRNAADAAPTAVATAKPRVDIATIMVYDASAIATAAALPMRALCDRVPDY